MRTSKARLEAHAGIALLSTLVLWAGMPAEAPVADAAMRGDLVEVRTLLRAGADVNAAQGDGMTALPYYEDFSHRVEQIGRDLHALVSELKAAGHRIVAYGAAAKGTIMVNYAGVDHTLIDYVMDMNVHKQGKTVPGVRIPIVAPDRLLADQPPYCLLLVWNLKKEILAAQEAYRRRGGRFIVPIPRPEIIEPLDVSNAPSAG